MNNILIIVVTSILIVILLFLRKLAVNYSVKKDFKEITDKNRGEKSERDLVYRLLKLKYKKDYIFYDVYLKKDNGDYSQLDVILLTVYGIISIEVKDYTGTIYGYGSSDEWTQYYNFKKDKRSFYNPIKQNYGHITALKNNISKISGVNIKDLTFYNLIVFYGKSRIRKIKGLNEYSFVTKPKWLYWTLCRIKIHSRKRRKISNTALSKISTMLKNAYLNNNSEEIRNTHLETVKMYQRVGFLKRIFRKLLSSIKRLFFKNKY